LRRTGAAVEQGGEPRGTESSALGDVSVSIPKFGENGDTETSDLRKAETSEDGGEECVRVARFKQSVRRFIRRC
jgi:hypothetical protein